MATHIGVLLHSLNILALVAAYVTITMFGNDGTALLGVLAGYIGAGGTQIATVLGHVNGKAGKPPTGRVDNGGT